MKGMKVVFWSLLALLPAALEACPGCSFPPPGAWKVFPQYRIWADILLWGIFLSPVIFYACGCRIVMEKVPCRKYVWRDTIILTLFWFLCFYIPGENYGQAMASCFFWIPNFLTMVVMGLFWSFLDSIPFDIAYILTIILVNAGLFYLVCRCLSPFRIVWKYSTPAS